MELAKNRHRIPPAVREARPGWRPGPCPRDGQTLSGSIAAASGQSARHRYLEDESRFRDARGIVAEVEQTFFPVQVRNC